MAKIRTIKPEFWTDGKIVGLTPFARLFFIGTWNFTRCDSGHVDDDHVALKLKILPSDTVDSEAIMSELVAVKLLERYIMKDGRTFLKIRRFSDHQKIDERWRTSCPYCENSYEKLEDSPESRETTRGFLKSHETQASLGESRETLKSLTRLSDGLDWIGLDWNGREGKEKEDAEAPRALDSQESPKIQPKENRPTVTASEIVLAGVDPTVAADWLRVRKSKRAPLTATAWAGVLREAGKAGLPISEAVRIAVERNWQTFEAGWLTGKSAEVDVKGTPDLAGFGQFWELYPARNRVNRGEAEAAWSKIPAGTALAEILDGLKKANLSNKWTGDGGKYIPSPTRWINAKGWLDEHPKTIINEKTGIEQINPVYRNAESGDSPGSQFDRFSKMAGKLTCAIAAR